MSLLMKSIDGRGRKRIDWEKEWIRDYLVREEIYYYLIWFNREILLRQDWFSLISW